MADTWIPNYIKRTIDYKPRDILTAQEYNAILNLIITQGDYNSAWLEYLQNDAIPDAIRDISIDVIEEAISDVVREEIAALSAEVINKTSAQLNNPMVTVLNTGLGYTGISHLDTLITSKNIKATYAIATNLIDTNPTYPTLVQLKALQNAGNDIVAYSTDGAPITASTVNTVVPAAYSYMNTNEFNKDVFVYPEGNSIDTVRNAVCNKFKYAVNIINNGVIIPDGILYTSPTSILGNLAVIHFDNTVSVNTVKAFIDDAVQYNKYLILQVDTDSSSYSSENLETIIDYILTNSNVVFPDSISDAMHEIHDTIENTLLSLENMVDVINFRINNMSISIGNINSSVESIGSSVESIGSSVNTLERTVDDLDNYKVDKVAGKGLSTNDYTNADKNKVNSIGNISGTVLDSIESTVGWVSLNKVDVSKRVPVRGVVIVDIMSTDGTVIGFIARTDYPLEKNSFLMIPLNLKHGCEYTYKFNVGNKTADNISFNVYDSDNHVKKSTPILSTTDYVDTFTYATGDYLRIILTTNVVESASVTINDIVVIETALLNELGDVQGLVPYRASVKTVINNIKNAAVNATDFADFQSRIANM